MIYNNTVSDIESSVLEPWRMCGEYNVLESIRFVISDLTKISNGLIRSSLLEVRIVCGISLLESTLS